MNATLPLPANGPAACFSALARRAQSRLLLIGWLRGLRELAWLPWLSLAAVAGLRLAGGRGWDLPLVAVGIALWSGLAFGLAWRRRTTPYRALAAWDAAGNRNDAVSSAYVFAGEAGSGDDPGRLLHVDRTRELAGLLASQLAAELPLPRVRWTWAGPVMAVVFALTPWLKPEISAGDRPLTEEMLAAAKAEGGEIAKTDDQKPGPLKGLTDEERKRIEELQKQMKELAARLQNAEGRTPREVLDDLEKQARAAEELAQQLGADRNAWASEEMLREMRKHPDTADLAEALANKQAGRAAEESRKLAAQLKDPLLTSEAAERIKNALDRTMQKAGDDDKKKMVGQHVGEADRQLKQEQQPAAGQEFQKLADLLARQEQRENAQQELEKLADRLRQSGSSIVGQKGEAMKKLDGQSGSNQSLMPHMAQLGQPSNQSGSSQPLPVPGLDQSKSRPGSSRGTPIPGTGKLSKNAKPMTMVPGTAPKAGKPLALAAPIPGTAPGKFIIPGGAALAGTGPPGLGGTEAGRGHAEMGKDPGKLASAAAQGDVSAAVNDEGDSFVQEIEGQPHNEAAQRTAKQTAARFLKTQEEAFDEKNLPPARREQVRRYFEALRKRFDE